MLEDIQLLIDEIETQRRELTASSPNLSDPDILLRSQRLDELINKYYEMIESIPSKERKSFKCL
jgi:hypothetical protein